MGIPIDQKDTKALLPVYRLAATPVVLLPGILYRVTFTPPDSLAVLQFFKGNKKINNLLLSQIRTRGDEPVRTISDDAIAGGRDLRRLLNGDRGDESAYDWLLLGLIPQEGGRICTISRIVGINHDQKNVVLTFQALTRGEILADGKFDVASGEAPVEVTVRAVSNRVSLPANVLDEQVKLYQEKVTTLFKKIDSFLQDFVVASSIDKSTEPGRRYALTLSPLANALNVQFTGDYKASSQKLKGLIEKFIGKLGDYSNKKTSEDFLKLLDLTIAILPIQKQEFLSKLGISDRLEHFHALVDGMLEMFDVLYKSVDYVDKFYSSASDMEKSKIISNQLKAIKFSLDSLRPKTVTHNAIPRSGGDSSGGQDDENGEMELIRKFLEKVPQDVNPDGAKLLKKDFKRLQRMPQQHSEYQVLRTYFDIVMDLPWGQYVNFNNIDVASASKQLDDDHYGLYHVKKRLLQYLAVLKLQDKADEAAGLTPHGSSNNNEELVIGEDPASASKPLQEPEPPKVKKTSKSPILLFVGPPGVGKTSLAKSIATALGRKFQRISLGGVRDESEIRGHRRTYVGSMPGVIVNALRKAGSMNPLILLDEIDKVSGGPSGAGRVNGDPAAALLEVLDPEQNVNFTDHYLGFPIDLSNVLFLCTANDLSTISAPLMDRTEVIELSGYTLEEKVNIGSKYLLPKQIKLNGLHPGDVIMEEPIWRKVVAEYIREAGVRNLERKVGSICRGKAVEFVENETKYDKNVSEAQLVKYLGLPTHPIAKDLLDKPKFSHEYGVVNGLSYNSDGSGGVLVFELVSIPTLSKNQNSPTLVLTGRLGETLTESIKIGVSFVKSILSRNLVTGVNTSEALTRFNNSELHLHVPMGGVSKDGPSAGITITLSLLSIALQRPVPGTVAMTGEITLRGKVLPIGGISEKLLGASQFGIKTVLVPKLNRKDVIEAFYNDDVKLMELVHNDSADPEKKVKEKLGIDLVYVDTFWDVIRAVWGESAVVAEELAHM
ncbi:Lon protease 2, peroxisomal [Cyberlindnera fabianii]|uniref:Lon protease homolog 2, peroxisomal n=1 Tax=Cyberlindnera fabianii TaxID=36022 RepID=A0A1V2L8X8_CYBFA|nr:Lon protease 2, peroxisomal [Cyberlindnera fabianii]